MFFYFLGGYLELSLLKCLITSYEDLFFLQEKKKKKRICCIRYFIHLVPTGLMQLENCTDRTDCSMANSIYT